MRIRVRMWSTVLLTAGCVWAQTPTEPPAVLRITREVLKPGKGAAHEKTELMFVRAATKAKYPSHYLAMDAIAGPNEVWFLEANASFAAMEQADKVLEAEPFKTEWQQAATADGELLSGLSNVIAVYRKNLSYRADQGMAMLPKARYFSVQQIRVRPNSEKRLAEAIKGLLTAYEAANVEQPISVYQVMAGGPSGTYLVLEPMASLSEWDKWPVVMKSTREAMGESAFEQMGKTFAEIVEGSVRMLFSVSPKMSYVSKEFASADPDFWIPKPPPAPKKAAAK
ncbi:MAG: hypothetical protein ABSH05_11920 [Bryobacteraceae bacterium]